MPCNHRCRGGSRVGEQGVQDARERTEQRNGRLLRRCPKLAYRLRHHILSSHINPGPLLSASLLRLVLPMHRPSSNRLCLVAYHTLMRAAGVSVYLPVAPLPLNLAACSAREMHPAACMPPLAPPVWSGGDMHGASFAEQCIAEPFSRSRARQRESRDRQGAPPKRK